MTVVCYLFAILIHTHVKRSQPKIDHIFFPFHIHTNTYIYINCISYKFGRLWSERNKEHNQTSEVAGAHKFPLSYRHEHLAHKCFTVHKTNFVSVCVWAVASNAYDCFSGTSIYMFRWRFRSDVHWKSEDSHG